MPSKTQEYLKLANRTANGITRYWEHWTDFSQLHPDCISTVLPTN